VAKRHRFVRKIPSPFKSLFIQVNSARFPKGMISSKYSHSKRRLQ